MRLWTARSVGSRLQVWTDQQQKTLVSQYTLPLAQRRQCLVEVEVLYAVRGKYRIDRGFFNGAQVIGGSHDIWLDARIRIYPKFLPFGAAQAGWSQAGAGWATANIEPS